MKNRTGNLVPVTNALLLTMVSVLSLCAIAVPGGHAGTPMSAADQCDAEAGSVYDTTRNLAFPPVAESDIRIGIALSACREAHNQGGTARQTFQLARVLYKAGERGKALTFLKQASDAGHALSMVNYAVMLGDRGDRETEFALYQKAAAAGNVLAAYNLGVAYRDGIGTTVNGQLASEWFARASLAGDDVGSFNLGVIYDEGTLVPEDNAKAASLYKLAASRGNVDAMVNLAMMLETGEGIDADPEAARAMYRKAADAGDVLALAKLAAPAPAVDTMTTASLAPAEQASLTLTKTDRLK